jgi:hypothetical protein
LQLSSGSRPEPPAPPLFRDSRIPSPPSHACFSWPAVSAALARPWFPFPTASAARASVLVNAASGCVRLRPAEASAALPGLRPREPWPAVRGDRERRAPAVRREDAGVPTALRGRPGGRQRATATATVSPTKRCSARRAHRAARGRCAGGPSGICGAAPARVCAEEARTAAHCVVGAGKRGSRAVPTLSRRCPRTWAARRGRDPSSGQAESSEFECALNGRARGSCVVRGSEGRIFASWPPRVREAFCA